MGTQVHPIRKGGLRKPYKEDDIVERQLTGRRSKAGPVAEGTEIQLNSGKRGSRLEIART